MLAPPDEPAIATTTVTYRGYTAELKRFSPTRAQWRMDHPADGVAGYQYHGSLIEGPGANDQAVHDSFAMFIETAIDDGFIPARD